MAETGGLQQGGSSDMLKKLEDMEKRLQKQLASFMEAKAEMDAMETVVTDDMEAVTVTVVGQGEIQSLDISVTGLRAREALGPIMTRTIAWAQEEHTEKLRNLRPNVG